MAASMGAALAGVDFTCHPYTPGGQVRIPAASRTDAAVAAVEAFLDQPPLRLRQTQICPGLGASSLSSWIFRTCDVSLFLHVVWPASPAAAHRFRRPSAHVQLTSGTVRMKSVIDSQTVI